MLAFLPINLYQNIGLNPLPALFVVKFNVENISPSFISFLATIDFLTTLMIFFSSNVGFLKVEPRAISMFLIDLIKFLKVIEKFEPDLIIGSRFKYSDYTRSHLFINRMGNFLITFLFNIFYQTTFTDIYSCYICFKKELFDHTLLKTDGFEQQAEMLCKIVKNGKIFFEVPINYNGRSHEDGKKIKFYHIFYVIYQIIIGRFK